ncbi:MAG: hypothetical protein JWO38_5171 [Gemmataceae bacterium]|nr:hypothetical protein [Gemmataceae bacterium]
MPPTPRRAPSAFPGQLEPDLPATSGRWVGWTVYTFLALTGFCFGVWAGNQRPSKATEVAKVSPQVKDSTPAAEKPEPKPADKLTPEPGPKKDPPAVTTPKTPEVVAPEPKPPEPKKPEPKPPEPKSPEPKKPAVAQVSFAKEIMPIFRSKCLNCHGAAGKPKGDLDLRTIATIMKGGDNGAGVKPGDLKDSLVWKTIDEGSMPPEGKEPLTAAEKRLVENWILGGAKP